MNSFGSGMFPNEFWAEMLDNQNLLKEQYELVGENSKWATEFNEIMIIVNENNEISDYTLYGLGLLDQSSLENLVDCYINGTQAEKITSTFTFDELLNLQFKVILEGDFYEWDEGLGHYVDVRTDAAKLENVFNNKGINIKVAGIIKEKANISAHSITAAVAYTSALTKYIIENNNQTDIVKAQLQNDTTDVKTGTAFTSQRTKELALKNLGYSLLDNPSEIKIYPTDFSSRNKIASFIDSYNDKCVAAGQDDKVITYSDEAGTIFSSVSTIITSITYVLIAFVSVSLVVSSIMIGVITYISVIERTNEIGILRSIGASKKDVGRVFNAESFIIGLSSGIMGIIISLILLLPINLILKHFTGISGIAVLSPIVAVSLIAISFILTLIAGFIPSRIAAKKDPVVALRSN